MTFTGILLSPLLPLVLGIAALYLVYKGKKERTEAVSLPSPALPPISNKSESNPTQTQTGIKFEQHVRIS